MQFPLISIIIPYWGYGLPADRVEYEVDCKRILQEHIEKYRDTLLPRTWLERYIRTRYGVDFSGIGRIPAPNLPGTYNSDWLEEARKSAYTQRYPNVEVIEGLPKDRKWNLAQARNYLIAQSKGEFIVCLDSDDIYHEDFLGHAYNTMIESGADIVHPPFAFFGDNFYIAGSQEMNAETFNTDNTIPYASMYRRFVWERYPYAEDMPYGYEDWDFWHGAIRNGFIFKLIPRIVFFYRRVGTSMVDEAHKHKDYNLARMQLHHKGTF
jgi:glycosyltransferase involved in cell wall biosynthesis